MERLVGVRVCGRGGQTSAGGSEPEMGMKHPAVRARGSVYGLRAGGTGCAGVRGLVTAGLRVRSGAV
jgi:hypothetical protein